MSTFTRCDPSRRIHAPHGRQLTCKSWLTEAPYRMIQHNLQQDVAENPAELVVYGGIGRAARNWECYDAILAALRELNDDETLLVQSGKPVGVFPTHPGAPRVLIANSNLVPAWANWEHFNELDRQGLMMFGQMTAGSWIYIGSQGIIQGTYETFVELGKQSYGGNFKGKWLTEGGYDDIAEQVFGRVEVDAFFLEFDSERAGGFEPLRFVPKDKRVVLGLVSSKVPQLEDRDKLKARIEEAAKYVSLETGAACPVATAPTFPQPFQPHDFRPRLKSADAFRLR